jgi:hypothetical protein
MFYSFYILNLLFNHIFFFHIYLSYLFISCSHVDNDFLLRNHILLLSLSLFFNCNATSSFCLVGTLIKEYNYVISMLGVSLVASWFRFSCLVSFTKI